MYSWGGLMILCRRCSSFHSQARRKAKNRLRKQLPVILDCCRIIMNVAEVEAPPSLLFFLVTKLRKTRVGSWSWWIVVSSKRNAPVLQAIRALTEPIGSLHPPKMRKNAEEAPYSIQYSYIEFIELQLAARGRILRLSFAGDSSFFPCILGRHCRITSVLMQYLRLTLNYRSLITILSHVRTPRDTRSAVVLFSQLPITDRFEFWMPSRR